MPKRNKGVSKEITLQVIIKGQNRLTKKICHKSTTFTDTAVSGMTSGRIFPLRTEAILSLFGCSEVKSTLLTISDFTNQNAWKALVYWKVTIVLKTHGPPPPPKIVRKPFFLDNWHKNGQMWYRTPIGDNFHVYRQQFPWSRQQIQCHSFPAIRAYELSIWTRLSDERSNSNYNTVNLPALPMRLMPLWTTLDSFFAFFFFWETNK